MNPISEALALLDVDRLLLSVPDAAHPWSDGEDLGRGSPYARASRRFLEFVAAQGFTGVQATPPGRVSPVNPSPYDGSYFARNEMFVRAHRLLTDPVVGPHLPPDAFWTDPHVDPGRVHHPETLALHKRWLAQVHGALDRALAAGRAADLASALEQFRADHDWLPFDRDYETAFDPSAIEGQAVDRYTLEQFLVHRQHVALRQDLAELNLQLWGDLQVGPGPMDRARLADCWLSGYLMGAPPSRTNPQGQPWGFPVFDPDQLDAAKPARKAFEARLDKLIGEYDGLRIDHPHGLVCPWVYRDGPDPQRSVQEGARLYESPHLHDHPELARYARVRPDQLHPDPEHPRYADDWVQQLDPEQIASYGELMRFVVERMGGADRIACEVLSTEPYPLRRVRTGLGLGRFLVTQKAMPGDPDDVYQVDRSAPADWVMIGNHDTPTIWGRIAEWSAGPRREREAATLARRLRLGPEGRRRLMADDRAMAQAKLSELFMGPARNVLVFFADLYGLTEPHNRPGVVHADNWSQRVPPDWSRPSLHVGAALADALVALDRAPDGLLLRLRESELTRA